MGRLKRDLIFLDCETTHVRPGDDAGEIIELAIVGENGQVLFDRKISPQHIETATQEALKINGYDPKIWDIEAVPFGDVAQEILQILQNKLIVGQHITFDTEFLKWEFRRAGLDLGRYDPSYNSIDIDSIVFHCLVPPLKKTSSHLVCEYFGINNDGAHEALFDAQRAREIFLELRKLRPNLQKWPTPIADDNKLIRQFQRDYQEHSKVTRKAALLRKWDRFSYPGSFKIYQAQTDAMPDSRYEGKVVLAVTDGGLRDGMRTRLNADLECEIHRPLCEIDMKPYVYDGFGN